MRLGGRNDSGRQGQPGGDRDRQRDTPHLDSLEDGIAYAALKAEYDDKMDALNKLHHGSKADQERIAKEQERQNQDKRAAEVQRLVEAMPELAKPEVQKKFWAESIETMAKYGFSQEEMNELFEGLQ